MKKFSAYRVTNAINGKAYIGITTQDVLARWRQHVKWAQRPNAKQPLANAIRAHGAHSFVVERVAEAVSWADLCDLERLLVAQDGTFGGGYNATCGGEGLPGYVMTGDDRAAMSDGMNASYARRRAVGVRNARFGTKSTPEHRAAQSVSMKRVVEENPDCLGRLRENTKRARALGAGFPNSRKLSGDQVRAIIGSYRCGRSMRDLAVNYEVSRATIGNIIAGRLYRDVPMDASPAIATA